MTQVLDAHLKRMERDPTGLAVRLYPFTRPDVREAPRLAVIDSRIAFGRPVLRGTRIPTAVIAPEGEIEEALRCELQIAA
jgi:hypothetical protein